MKTFTYNIPKEKRAPHFIHLLDLTMAQKVSTGTVCKPKSNFLIVVYKEQQIYENFQI